MDNNKHQKKRKRIRRKQWIRYLGACGVWLTCTVIAGKIMYEQSRKEILRETYRCEQEIAVGPDEDLLFENEHDTELEETSSDSQTVSVNASDWNLLLVNPWNELPQDFTVKLTRLKNGHAIDERAYPDLQAMMDAARAEGLSPVICSSYRTEEKQQMLFSDEVNKYLALGYSPIEAEIEAGKWVAVPGTSEHQTGLAVDIVASNDQQLDRKQENTAEQKWLMENSYKFGFILRYPNGKSEITGISYEPWHYRYVGREAAREIYERGICLEEYLESLSAG